MRIVRFLLAIIVACRHLRVSPLSAISLVALSQFQSASSVIVMLEGERAAAFSSEATAGWSRQRCRSGRGATRPDTRSAHQCHSRKYLRARPTRQRTSSLVDNNRQARRVKPHLFGPALPIGPGYDDRFRP